VRIKNLRWTIVLGAILLGLSACSSTPANSTVIPTRPATQTPYIIYMPVTTTPEAALPTLLPTVVTQASAPTKTPTRAVATTKPVAAPTKPPVAPPVAAVPTATAVPPPCNLGSTTLIFPDNGAPRKTKQTGPASDTFEFKWTPFQQTETDGQTGYLISIESRLGTKIVNSDRIFISHNAFLRNAQRYVYDAQKIYNLAAPAGGESVSVFWTVTVVKTTGNFDDQGKASGNVITCGAPSQRWMIALEVMDQ
jgi:hypothetical protein